MIKVEGRCVEMRLLPQPKREKKLNVARPKKSVGRVFNFDSVYSFHNCWIFFSTLLHFTFCWTFLIILFLISFSFVHFISFFCYFLIFFSPFLSINEGARVTGLKGSCFLFSTLRSVCPLTRSFTIYYAFQ